MNKLFTFHCGASSLVSDDYIEWEVKAENPGNAYCQAYCKAMKNNVMDSGSVGCYMDAKELATELGNIAANDYNEWTPTTLLTEINALNKGSELYATLEWIVCGKERE